MLEIDKFRVREVEVGTINEVSHGYGIRDHFAGDGKVYEASHVDGGQKITFILLPCWDSDQYELRRVSSGELLGTVTGLGVFLVMPRMTKED